MATEIHGKSLSKAKANCKVRAKRHLQLLASDPKVCNKLVNYTKCKVNKQKETRKKNEIKSQSINNNIAFDTLSKQVAPRTPHQYQPPLYWLAALHKSAKVEKAKICFVVGAFISRSVVKAEQSKKKLVN